MNKELLVKLMEQAGLKEQLETFAESIVYECLSVISEENTKLENEWRCKDGKHIWFKIADHFGIKK